MDWFRRQLTIQNILMVLVLVSSLTKNTAGWVTGLSSVTSDNTKAIAEIVKAQADERSRQEAFDLRLRSLENYHLTLNDEIAKSFLRRSELEPRLKAMEDQITETNRLWRRFLENYRR